MNLNTATDQEVSNFARELFLKHRNTFKTFEEIASFCTQRIYENFVDDENESMFALVRVFRACRPSELPPEEVEPPSNNDTFLCLFGSTGDKPEWNDRRKSSMHRVIPADAFTTPMLKAAFDSIEITSVVNTNFIRNASEQATYAKYFHVENAEDSPYIVDQENFVEPYGIQSVVGIGSPFASGSFYLCLAFSKYAINEVSAKRFAMMSPFISTMLASYDARQLWNE